MNRLAMTLCGAAALALSGGAAQAADGDWSGIILGLQGGFATGDADPWTVVTPIRNAGGLALNDAFPGTAYNGSFNLDGAAGGVNVGYNFQTGQWVWGGEVALNVAGISDTYMSTVGAADDIMTTEVDFYLTAAAKAGYAFNSSLLYVKGGYAGGNVEASLSDTVGVSGTWAANEWFNGFVVGGGFDHYFGNGIIAGVEYNYIDLGSGTLSTGAAGPGSGTITTDVQIHSFMAKVSIKLDSLFGN